MQIIFIITSRLRRLFAAPPPPRPDPLARMNLRELADLPPTHPLVDCPGE